MLVGSLALVLGCGCAPSASSADPRPSVPADTGRPEDTATAPDTAADTDVGLVFDTGPADECVPNDVCADGLCTLDLDAHRIDVYGSVVYDGGSVPDEDSYYVILRSLATGSEIREYFPHDTGWHLRIFPGTYDLSFRLYDSGNAEIPLYERLVLDRDTRLDLDVQVHTVSGSASWEGGRPASDADGPTRYTILAEDVATGAVHYRSFESGEEWELQLPPRTYDLSFRVGGDDYHHSGAIVSVARGVVVTDDTHLALSAKLNRVSGQARFEGEPVPARWDDEWRDYYVALVDQETGLRTYAAFFQDETWSLDVPDGVYDLTLRVVSWDQSLNDEVLVADDLVVTGDLTHEIDVLRHTVSGTATYGGGPVPDTAPYANHDYVVTFENVATGSLATRAFHHAQGWSIAVPAGTYDVRFALLTEGQYLLGSALVLDDLAVTGDMTRDIVVTPYELSGTVRYDGGAVPDVPDAAADYAVQAVDVETGETATGEFIHRYGWSLVVTPGTYDVRFRLAPGLEHVGAGVLVADDLVVSGDTPLDLVVDPYTVTGTASFGDTPPRDYAVSMVNVETGETAYGAFEWDEGWALDVTAGTYALGLETQETPTPSTCVSTCVEVGP